MDFNKAMSAVEFIAEQKEPHGNGLYVAHVMAAHGYQFPEDSNILTLANESGWTVAHEMARGGHNFTNNDILDLKDTHGVTVASLM